MKRFTLVLVVLALAPLAGRAQTPADKEVTRAFLHKLQQPDGSYAAAPGGPAGLRSTSAGLRALRYFGSQPQDAERSGQFVLTCIDTATGGFADRPGQKPDVYNTAVGLMALAELKRSSPKITDAAARYLDENVRTFEDVRIAAAGLEAVGKRSDRAPAWLQLITTDRHADGTFGKNDGVARDTGGAVAALLRLGGPVEERANVVRALRAGQRADGGFGKEGAASDLETTYRVLRAFVMLKEKPDADRCRAFVARCRNADGGYGVAPGQPSSVSGTYFAGVLLLWLGE